MGGIMMEGQDKSGEGSPCLEGDRIPLGATTVQISPLGIGTWSWGDRMIWGYGDTYGKADLEEAFQVSLQMGINFFDTAEAYGWGQSERMLGQFIHQCNQSVVVATKFLPSPWRLRKASLLHALHRSLKRLGMEQVDLYQFHKPYPPVPFETWIDALVEAVRKGQTRAVGISNCSKEQMLQAIDILADYGISLSSNQVEYSLLHREPEYTNLLKSCHHYDVTFLAYSPLALGLLTGKYTSQNPPVNRFNFRERVALRALSVALPDYTAAKGCRFGSHQLTQVEPLIDLLKNIGEQRGKTPAQVALNWVICKGAVPIVGVKNARQARENAGALGWHLTAEQIGALDEVSHHVEPFLRST
jgi:aryl-alcohol dehydrogenase-like predicted oxidoreductase